MFDNKDWKKYLIPLIVTVISIYALFLRFDDLGRRELWGDELNQLSIMDQGVLHLIKELPHHEANTYLNGDHFLIYPFFKIFSYNKWGLAIPHIFSTILGFYLLYLIGKRYFKTIWGYIISFGVICFNASLIKHATEVRPYAVLPTLALAGLYFSGMLVNEANLSPRKKFFIGAFFLLTALFHTYGFFILFFCLLYSLLNKPGARTFKSILRDNSKMAVFILSIGLPFWLFSVFGPLHVVANIDVYQFFHNPRVNIIGFLKDIFGNLIGFKKFYFLLAAILFPFIFPYKERLKQILFLFIMVILPVLSVYLCDVIGRCYFVQRQFIWVMPYFALFLGWSGDSFVNYILRLKR